MRHSPYQRIMKKIMAFEMNSFPEKNNPPRSFEETFLLTEQAALAKLFQNDEARIARWLLEDNGVNGERLRSVTKKYLADGQAGDAAAENIAAELRAASRGVH